MRSVSLQAQAKINLSLDILGKRADGYHEVRTVMVTVPLCDDVTVSLDGDDIKIIVDRPYIPADRRNIAWKAAEAFLHSVGSDNGVSIYIKKRIPVQAGMGGGSADGAAVLKGLNELMGGPLSTEELLSLAAGIGSDVPFCAVGGSALGTGRGEKLEYLPDIPKCSIVVVKPAFSVSTPELYSKIDSIALRYHPDTDGMLEAIRNNDLNGIAHRCFNVFEEALDTRNRNTVDEIKGTLLAGGALGAAMTGSGSAVFGLFSDDDLAQETAAELKNSFRSVFCMKN